MNDQKNQEARVMVCPNCSAELQSEVMFCTQCGFDLTRTKKMEDLLENDPEIKALNNKYISAGIGRLVCGIALFLSLFLMYQFLENDWHDIFFDIGLLFFPVSSISFICFCCSRGRLAKKIRKLLNQKLEAR